jgi:hypothetical protein
MKRKRAKALPRPHAVRPVAPATTSRGTVLRAVLVAAVAASAGCDPVADVTRTLHRAGEFLGVVDPPRTAGEMAPVRAMPPAASVTSASATPAASGTPPSAGFSPHSLQRGG